MKDDDIMNLQEAAEMLGVTRHTLKRWIEKGVDIPHRRVSEKKWFFYKKAIKEWAGGQESNPYASQA